MKTLIWGLLIIAVAVGVGVARQRREAKPGEAPDSASRLRRALPARPHLPSTDVNETLGEAIKEAAGEVAPSS